MVLRPPSLHSEPIHARNTLVTSLCSCSRRKPPLIPNYQRAYPLRKFLTPDFIASSLERRANALKRYNHLPRPLPVIPRKQLHSTSMPSAHSKGFTATVSQQSSPSEIFEKSSAKRVHSGPSRNTFLGGLMHKAKSGLNELLIESEKAQTAHVKLHSNAPSQDVFRTRKKAHVSNKRDDVGGKNAPLTRCQEKSPINARLETPNQTAVNRRRKHAAPPPFERLASPGSEQEPSLNPANWKRQIRCSNKANTKVPERAIPPVPQWPLPSCALQRVNLIPIPVARGIQKSAVGQGNSWKGGYPSSPKKTVRHRQTGTKSTGNTVVRSTSDDAPASDKHKKCDKAPKLRSAPIAKPPKTSVPKEHFENSKNWTKDNSLRDYSKCDGQGILRVLTVNFSNDNIVPVVDPVPARVSKPLKTSKKVVKGTSSHVTVPDDIERDKKPQQLSPAPVSNLQPKPADVKTDKNARRKSTAKADERDNAQDRTRKMHSREDRNSLPSDKSTTLGNKCATAAESPAQTGLQKTKDPQAVDLGKTKTVSDKELLSPEPPKKRFSRFVRRFNKDDGHEVSAKKRRVDLETDAPNFHVVGAKATALQCADTKVTRIDMSMCRGGTDTDSISRGQLQTQKVMVSPVCITESPFLTEELDLRKVARSQNSKTIAAEALQAQTSSSRVNHNRAKGRSTRARGLSFERKRNFKPKFHAIADPREERLTTIALEAVQAKSMENNSIVDGRVSLPNRFSQQLQR